MLHEISLDRGYGNFPFTLCHSGEIENLIFTKQKIGLCLKLEFQVRLNAKHYATGEKGFSLAFCLSFSSSALWQCQY